MELNEHYQKANVKVKGSTPSSHIDFRGEAIVSAITELENAPNASAAEAFLEFLLNEDKGMMIIKQSGHNSLIPIPVSKEINLPNYLKKYTIEIADRL